MASGYLTSLEESIGDDFAKFFRKEVSNAESIKDDLAKKLDEIEKYHQMTLELFDAKEDKGSPGETETVPKHVKFL